MFDESTQKKKFLENLRKPRKVVQLEPINDEEIKRIQQFLHIEVAKMFETFFILRQLNNFPFSILTKENHRFVEYLYTSLRDSLLLSLNRMIIDKKPDCWTLDKYERLIRSTVPKELLNQFDAAIESLDIIPSDNKDKVIKALRDCKISHNIPNKNLKPDEIGYIDWNDLEGFVLSILEKFRLFDSMFSSISFPAFSFNYYDDFYGKSQSAIHDVDCFIIDYLDRHFPGILELPVEQIKTYPRGLFNEPSEVDIPKISYLQTIVKQANDRKQTNRNINNFLLNQMQNE